jgi:hypothetical protein
MPLRKGNGARKRYRYRSSGQQSHPCGFQMKGAVCSLFMRRRGFLSPTEKKKMPPRHFLKIPLDNSGY